MTITYYDVDGEMVLYSTAPVTINPDPIVYNTWELSKSIRVKVNNTLWSANTASYFEVHFTFTGSDAAAYKEQDSNDLTFAVITSSTTVPTPTLELSGEIVTKSWSWSGLLG